MNKLCRNALASCLAATFAVGGGIAVPAASGASLEQDTAVAGMAVSLDNYYASSQTPEADIMDYIRYIVASAQEKKNYPSFYCKCDDERRWFRCIWNQLGIKGCQRKGRRTCQCNGKLKCQK